MALSELIVEDRLRFDHVRAFQNSNNHVSPLLLTTHESLMTSIPVINFEDIHTLEHIAHFCLLKNILLKGQVSLKHGSQNSCPHG